MIIALARSTALAALAGCLVYAAQGQLRAPVLSQPAVAKNVSAGASLGRASRSLTIPAGRNGHYEIEAKVNGKRVRFMIDTGASGVVLNRDDAGRVGLRPSERDFAGRARTANGPVRYAPVVLRDFRIGGLTLNGLPASVNGGPLDISLLGMDFLSRLKAYEVRNGRLVLYW